MKKTLLIFSIGLLAAGCNSQKVSDLEKQNQDLQAQLTKQQQVNNFDLDTQCSKQAQIFFDYWETDPVAKQNDEVSNHYNIKLNKCFVKIRQGINPSNNYYTEYLFDAIEKKQYGNFSVGIPTYQKPLICEMLDKFCQNQDEYNTFVNGYMNN